MRLIDADKLKQCYTGTNGIDDKAQYGSICKMIDNQPNIEVPRWIPVEGGPPKKHGYYSVTVLDKSGEKYVRPIMFDNLGFATSGFQEVLAWMELPSPYQKGAQ